jgi:type II secretory pathway component GspD/PulD (secretin)
VEADGPAPMAVSVLSGRWVTVALATAVVGVTLVRSGRAQQPTAREPALSVVRTPGDSVTIHLADVDLRAAVAALAPYFDRPVSFGAVPSVRVTLETPHPIPRSDVPRVARSLVESQGLELKTDTLGNMYRVQAAPPPAPQPPQAPPVSGLAGRAGGAIGVGQPGAPQFFVIRLHHARATDVAATVNALYGRASALGESGLAGGPGLSQQLAQNQLPPIGAPAAPQAIGAVAGRVATLSGETSIVPDAGTNSLFIRANRSDFDLIEAAVEQLDVRPLQVLIEVVIAEVDRNKSFALGIDASASHKNATGDSLSGGISSGLGLGDFVGRVMKIGNPAFAAQLTAASARGDARILSRPVVLAANNEQAEILVGSQQPFIQVSQTQVGAVAQNQVVQYQAVGTRLLVRPTISGDGYVTLDVTQEVNQATTQVVFNAPVISTRTVRTRLLVRDGQTVVLGGLSDRERNKNSGGIPILSSIPIIGGLFGHTTRSTTESEFFLFLTPHVVATDAAADSLTKPFQKRTDVNDP